MGAEGPNESQVVRLADKRLYAIFQTGSRETGSTASSEKNVAGVMGQTWSSDDCKTWTPPSPVGFEGVSPRIIRLSNGVLACTYGRPAPVVIMFNIDGTATKWSNLTEIFPKMSTRYTDLIEVEPGKILVIYDSVPYGWHPIPFTDRKARNSIYGTFVYVSRK
jgi:hypothetical protein